MRAEQDSVSLKNNNCLTASSAACQGSGGLCWLAGTRSPGLWLDGHHGGGASVDDMGDGCLPGKNSLTLIVKGGERAIEGEEGREDRRVDFMMQGLDLRVPV